MDCILKAIDPLDRSDKTVLVKKKNKRKKNVE